MNLDHLDEAQLSYLEGLVKKCAEAGADPRIVIKIAGEFSKGLGEIFDVSETQPFKSLGGGGDWGIGEPDARLKALSGGKPSPFGVHPYGYDPSGGWRGMVRKYQNLKPGDTKTMTPEQQNQAKYFEQMAQHPEFQAASKADAYGPKGWGRIKRYVSENLLPYGNLRKIRNSSEDAIQARYAQERMRQRYMMNTPYKALPKAVAAPIPIPGLQYTAYNEPYNFGAKYQVV